MNREQAREIADQVFSEWRVRGGELRGMIADALHAAYEAERELEAAESRVKEAAKPSPRTLVFQPMSAEDMRASARLASIKETARGLFASRRVVLVNSAFDQAEHFEETFERRYGGKP